MTGLNRQTDQIMSICCFVTDAQLNLLDTAGYEVVIKHDKATLDGMDEWCTRTHGQSGLTAACLASETTAEAAADGLLEYIRRFVSAPRHALLAGNSVHADKDFLSKVPYDRALAHLHYRILDVSSLKEAAMRWAGDDALQGVPRKKGLHQAREDVLESIEEARYYRRAFFAPTP
jgi:oligoribonuclease